MRRFAALLCASLIAVAAAPAAADVIDPEEEEKSEDDDSACSVTGFGSDDATPFAPLLLGVVMLGAVRRREE